MSKLEQVMLVGLILYKFKDILKLGTLGKQIC